jgi:hypothetical protein
MFTYLRKVEHCTSCIRYTTVIFTNIIFDVYVCLDIHSMFSLHYVSKVSKEGMWGVAAEME